DWMSPATKAQAKEKLAKFRPKIGYPDKWKDYSAIAIRADDLVGNLQRARAFVTHRTPGHQRSTEDNSRANIAHHYDLSNELFALFLDDTLSYSSALFDT
ncbi:class I SAM-dependent methyltransferase, partial [Streptomyces caeruleatus]